MFQSVCDFHSLVSKFRFPYLNNMSKILYIALFGIQQFAHNVTVAREKNKTKKNAFKLAYIKRRSAKVGKVVRPLAFQKCGRMQRDIKPK